MIEPEKPAIAKQWLGKHVPAATNTHATIENYWKWSMLRRYNDDQWDKFHRTQT
jgi:hypothetical protein